MAMEYDFDERIERKNTDSFKYDRMVESCGGNDCSLPMWVADMDFPTPPFVLNAIEKRMSQRVLGYTCSSDEYHSAIAAWCDRQYCWKYDCAIACYSDEGDVWRRSMLEYVNGNIDLLESGLAPFGDRIRVIRPQASFLVFLDCRGLGFENPDDYLHFFSDRCGVCMNPGNMFGKGGYGYMRMNVGCPRSTVLEAVRRMASVLKQL